MSDKWQMPLFSFCPMCGSNQLKPLGSNLLVCGKCDYYQHFNPVVAVAGFLADPTGRILLIRRAHEPSKGKLGAPGGFVDIGETAEAALHREVKEEVNLELDRIEYLASYPNEYPYRGQIVSVLDLFFIGHVRSWSDAKPLDEVDGLALVDPKGINAAELAFSSLRSALKDYVMRDT